MKQNRALVYIDHKFGWNYARVPWVYLSRLTLGRRTASTVSVTLWKMASIRKAMEMCIANENAEAINRTCLGTDPFRASKRSKANSSHRRHREYLGVDSSPLSNFDKASNECEFCCVCLWWRLDHPRSRILSTSSDTRSEGKICAEVKQNNKKCVSDFSRFCQFSDISWDADDGNHLLWTLSDTKYIRSTLTYSELDEILRYLLIFNVEWISQRHVTIRKICQVDLMQIRYSQKWCDQIFLENVQWKANRETVEHSRLTGMMHCRPKRSSHSIYGRHSRITIDSFGRNSSSGVCYSAMNQFTETRCHPPVLLRSPEHFPSMNAAAIIFQLVRSLKSVIS